MTPLDQSVCTLFLFTFLSNFSTLHLLSKLSFVQDAIDGSQMVDDERVRDGLCYILSEVERDLAAIVKKDL